MVASPIFMSFTVPPVFLFNILTSSVILFPKSLLGIDFLILLLKSLIEILISLSYLGDISSPGLSTDFK